MINLLQLSKLIYFTLIFSFAVFNTGFADTAEDIWKKKENKNAQSSETENDDIIIQSPVLTEEENIDSNIISELELNQEEKNIIGLFDPQVNNFNLSMWQATDGNEIKATIKRINKLKLSKFSEDLLFNVLFTNSYPPIKNLSSEEFLKIKINWLVKKRRIQDLEKFLLTNIKAANEEKAIKFLIDEKLSNAEIKSACESVSEIGKNISNNYLDKFKIYCLINNDRKEEAQLLYELLKDRGFNDGFFEDKFNYLLGYKEKTSQEILDNNLLNFYLSQITVENFNYKPNEKTDKYIWRYLSSSNLIQLKDLEDEKIILTYEKAASEDSFKNNEIFKIYKQILFNVNQLINANEVYKNLPNYKARALLYQSILLSDSARKKLDLTFVLKKLFEDDKLTSIFKDELMNILRSIDSNDIPEDYKEIVQDNLDRNFESVKKVKFDNEILHRSKIIKHFLDNNEKINKTEKDFKSVYKKIKRNKKYFISIMDIIVLESLSVDGINLPNDLNLDELTSQLTVPSNLQDLVNQNQLGLVMLKIIEIIGEDKVSNLDPETTYFLVKILNELNLKKIRNDILSITLPVKV